MNRRRLDFEATRDAILAVCGRLDRAIGGPPVKEIVGSSSTRRTVYGYIDRLNLPGLFRAFDFPDPNTTSPARSNTTVPPQALFLMNHPFVIECARKLLRRPDVAGETCPASKVERLYRLLYGRGPTDDELEAARQFVELIEPRDAALVKYAQALLLSNEFVFLD
jgi:hypothetical protein